MGQQVVQGTLACSPDTMLLARTKQQTVHGCELLLALQVACASSPVTIACTKKPSMDIMARRPFLSSLTFSSARVSGSSARPRGSKAPPAGTPGQDGGRSDTNLPCSTAAVQPRLPQLDMFGHPLTGVQVVLALAKAAGALTVGAVDLHGAHEQHLDHQRGHDALRMDQAGVAQVVQAAVRKDLCAGLEPHGLAKLHAAVLLEHLGEDAASIGWRYIQRVMCSRPATQRTLARPPMWQASSSCPSPAQRAEHGPAGVDDLHGAEALERLGVGGQAGGVPAVVAGELASQVGGHQAIRERAQELGPVGACGRTGGGF